MGLYDLGYYENEDDAIVVRGHANAAVKNSTFPTWLEGHRQRRSKELEEKRTEKRQRKKENVVNVPKGVSWSDTNQKWEAYIMICKGSSRQKKALGNYKNKQDALAVCEAAENAV